MWVRRNRIPASSKKGMVGGCDGSIGFVFELLVIMIGLEMIRSMRFGCYFLKAMFTRYPSE